MITIPWPAHELSPNARVHHQVKARFAKKQKAVAWALTMEARGRKRLQDDSWLQDGSYTLHMRFCPPDNQRRDMDNALGACKSAIDGIAAAMGVDDSRFRYVLEWGEKGEGKPTGFVRINVEES